MFKQKKKIALIGVGYILGLFILIFLSRFSYIELIVGHLAKLHYTDDLTFMGDRSSYVILFIYSIVAFFWTERTLNIIQRRNAFFWVINLGLDYILIPLSVLVMVLFHNQKYMTGTVLDLSLIENFFLIWVFMAVKHLAFRIIFKVT
jgi:hypothetical protein